MSERHGSGRDPDPTDLEAEGIPDLEDQPPGYTAETMVEGLTPPRDHPMGVEDEVTPREQRERETVAEREERLEPEVSAWVDDEPVGRLVQPDRGMPGQAHEAAEVGELAADRGGESAEEAAVHVVDERTGRPPG